MNHDDFTSTKSTRSWPQHDADASFKDGGHEKQHTARDDMPGSRHFSELTEHAHTGVLLRDGYISPDEIAAARKRVRARVFAEIDANGTRGEGDMPSRSSANDSDDSNHTITNTHIPAASKD